MSLSVSQFFLEARAAEEQFTNAFDTKLESLDDAHLSTYSSVLESHDRRVCICCLPSPFRWTDDAIRQARFFMILVSFGANSNCCYLLWRNTSSAIATDLECSMNSLFELNERLEW